MSCRFNIIIFVFLFCACKNTIQKEINPYDQFIHNPMTAAGDLDTNQVPKLFLPESHFNFGTIKSGDTVIHEFKFYNRGNAPLLITDVSSSCGCTIPNITARQLNPGDSSILTVIFDSSDKIGFQEKKITIFANTFPPESNLYIFGVLNH